VRVLVKRLVWIGIIGLMLSSAAAQGERLKAGDPPLASLITISAPDESGMVTISGAAGSVFPTAQVAIRNLYTGDTVYVQGGITGTFKAQIYGPGNTPFWISPTEDIPNSLRNQPGSLPGGPGTIVYGPALVTPPLAVPITTILIDGTSGDWGAYTGRTLATSSRPAVEAFANRDSLLVRISMEGVPGDYGLANVEMALDGTPFNAAFDPRSGVSAGIARVDNGVLRELGAFAIAASQGEVIEARIPLGIFNPNNVNPATVVVKRVWFTGADGLEAVSVPVEGAAPRVEEIDGITRSSAAISDPVGFTLSGTVAQGANRWLAAGQMNQLAFAPGDTLTLQLDVTMETPDLSPGLAGLVMQGELRLLPIAGEDGWQTGGGLDSNNGWSDVLTPSGLAISNLRGDFLVATTQTPANQVIRRDGRLVFPLDFAVTLPADLPDGLYVPVFEGFGQVADGARFRWDENGPLGTGQRETVTAATRLPVVLKVGAVESGHLLFTLFQDVPRNGNRGVMAEADQGRYGLANRVRFDSPTAILPPARNGEPIPYPLEPYLLNQMPNAYNKDAPPLIPFLFPGGRLTVQVTRPDGTVDNLGSTAIIQNQLSTMALDERALFGRQTQVDVYRLTTRNPQLTGYVFQQYGEYQIEVTGNLEDIWGNRYEGGGVYRVVVAEPLEIMPGVLSGTPFTVGNAFYGGLQVLPGLQADVTVRLRVYPVDGSEPSEYVVEGKTSAGGYFSPNDEGFRFTQAGEYVVDYEARYTGADGRLWAGSLRSAGVVASTEPTLIAHGRRGLEGITPEPAAAWFIASQYAPDRPARLQNPYYVGDVAWMPDGVSGEMALPIRVQDTTGRYTDWLRQNLPTFMTPDGEALNQVAVKDELPAAILGGGVNEAYTYVSAVTPGVSVRQYIQGGLDGGLDLTFDADDPLNQQTGAGIDGLRAGDPIFLFGGAVVRNAEAGVNDVAAYAALAIVTDPKAAPGARVFPPYQGQAGGGSGGPLLTIREEPVYLFFQPTGVRPGSVLQVGDVFTVAGQVGPTLASTVDVTITSPRGKVRQWSGTASATGYYYDPAQSFQADEAGIWTVDVTVRHEGLTSVGAVEPPPPVGGVLGANGGRFTVVVTPKVTESLAWSDERTDFAIPPTSAYNFRFEIPEGWDQAQITYVVSTPTQVLEEGPGRLNGRTFSYQYSLQRLSQDFPNMEGNRGGQGGAAADVITLTFVATGVDGSGLPQVRSRSFTITYDRLMTFF
jgi:hypothetical protein